MWVSCWRWREVAAWRLCLHCRNNRICVCVYCYHCQCAFLLLLPSKTWCQDHECLEKPMTRTCARTQFTFTLPGFFECIFRLIENDVGSAFVARIIIHYEISFCICSSSCEKYWIKMRTTLVKFYEIKRYNYELSGFVLALKLAEHIELFLLRAVRLWS